MGRDVAGLRFEKKPSVVNVKPNGTNNGAVHVAPKAIPEKVETKDSDQADDHTVKGRPVDESNKKPEAVGIIKSTNHEPEVKIIRAEAQKPTDKTLSSPVKSTSPSAVNGTIDANSIEPLTPAAEADKQISRTSHSNGDESNDSGVKFSSQANMDTPMPTKSSVLSFYFCALAIDIVGLNIHSTATSVRKSRVTVPVGPKFCCVDRLERRKEFYSKLEEKHKAMEKERLEHEARIKEEEEKAIKQLRKSMVYKANPVPSFYREGPPPKVELKKVPVTRAKSPNLTRRKSFGDAVKISPEEKGSNGRAACHSARIYREGKDAPVTPKGNDRIGARKLNVKSKVTDDHPQEMKEETTENSLVQE
ncbi:hypothetical protein DH2020_002976 [Rehmannia glutinosa]|uniref:TPX2 C-terminal domain-containing protein n=1 Tax=Rehmannia glutinosa TaxID=99300 RepID=A0ABR0XV88_REHGL